MFFSYLGKSKGNYSRVCNQDGGKQIFQAFDNFNEIVLTHDEIKSVLSPNEVGFHHEVISSIEDGFS